MDRLSAHNRAKNARDRLLTWWLRPGFASCGPGTRIAWPISLVDGADRLAIGPNTSMGPGCEFWIGAGASVHIGEDCEIMGSLRLAAAERVDIGDSVLIATNVVVVDSQHRTSDRDRPIRHQGLGVSTVPSRSACAMGRGLRPTLW